MHCGRRRGRKEPITRIRTWIALTALALVSLAPVAARASTTAEARARELLASAQRRLARGTPEARQFARGELEEAALLAPADRAIGLALGGVYLDADMLSKAGGVARTLLERDSADADANFLLARTWRREWLIHAEETARDRAIVHASRSARFAPERVDRWALLVPLLVDAGEDDDARTAATLAARALPGDPEAKLLLAYTAQRTGDLSLAQHLFETAIPALPAAARRDFDDVTPLVPSWRVSDFEDMPARQRTAWAKRFWRESDPDPVTPENEAQLEFWSRVEHARSLWGRSSLGDWDMRAELYIRYGPPAWVDQHPMLRPGLDMFSNWLVWNYPDLGMRVWMEAHNPTSGYSTPFSFYAWPAMPFADSLAKREELAAVAHGWALFRKTPPRTDLFGIGCALAQFSTGGGPQVLAQAEAAGEPADEMTVGWAVLDSALDVVARTEAPMGASACRPAEARAASWASTLPPGRYRLGVHVTDGMGRRGIAVRDFVLGADAGEFSLSDLVVTCGPPARSVVPGSGVRLEPETGLFPAHDPQLNAYFEIYHLAREGDEAPFEYVCTVRAAGTDTRPWLQRTMAPRRTPPPIEFTRRERAQGPVRRQFLTVPIVALPGGTYQVEVRVRDVTSGAEETRTATFVRGD
jgi:GWxTD domain-containing protein